MDLALLRKSLENYPVGSEEHDYIQMMITLETPVAVVPKPDVKSMSLADLRSELHELRARKCWNDRYFTVDREVQDRATWEWVKEDVFGQGK